MKVQVLFFGATADETGEREIEFSLAENTNANQAFAEIVEKFPRLKNHKLLFAVNQEYASGGEIVKGGDELAVFTAVSGG
ncbi:MAG: molybdopterin converting factor, subunit 1 [Acidobacteria bacterium]|jgi:molybdopterin converting factor small subunit|nr:molybdopterin converting factor, subunit 1 [Acidobacteriota bacterium]